MMGKNIQTIRKSKGLTLSELADRANISKSYLSNIERNLNQNPSILIVEKIASVLDVDFRLLLGVDHNIPNGLESEWIDFVNELKQSGVGIDELREYKAVIKFADWQNKQKKNKENEGND